MGLTIHYTLSTREPLTDLAADFKARHRLNLAASAFRFVDELPAEELATLWSRLNSDDLPVEVNRRQQELLLAEEIGEYKVSTGTRSKRSKRKQ